MKKSIFFILFLVMISSVYAQGYVREIVETNLYTIGGTVADDYNEGKFRIDDGISGVFMLEIDSPIESEYSIVFRSELGKDYECLSYNLSNSNDTIYDSCTVHVNETGNYYVLFNIDDEEIYVETLEVVDAKPPTFFWILLILGVGLFILSVTLPVLSIVGTLFLLSALTNVLFTYKYVFNADIFIGLIGLLILGIITLVLLVLKNLLK